MTKTRAEWVEVVMGTKTDRELLELAAAAANMDVMWDREELADFCAKRDGMWLKNMRSDSANCEYWNPLIDDGDAFRLAVELSLIVNFPHENGVYVSEGHEPPFKILELAKPDKYAAVRRVIVRAAARIGESK